MPKPAPEENNKEDGVETPSAGAAAAMPEKQESGKPGAVGTSTMGNFSRADAERIMRSMLNSEKQVMKKVKSQQSKNSGNSDTKDW